MRSLKAILSILISLILVTVPIAAYALTVTVGNTQIGTGNGTTTVDLSSVDINGFTIRTCDSCVGPARAVARVSAGLELIELQMIKITAPASLPATAGTVTTTANSTTITFSAAQTLEPGTFIKTAGGKVYVISAGSGTTYMITEPVGMTAAETDVTWIIGVKIEITATSDVSDFAPKLGGDYSSSVAIDGSFKPDTAPGGDIMSVTGIANTQGDVLNLVGGAGVDDVPFSLPKGCTVLSCIFKAGNDIFSKQIIGSVTELIHLDCGPDTLAQCRPSLIFKANMIFFNPGNQVEIGPGSAKTVRPNIKGLAATTQVDQGVISAQATNYEFAAFSVTEAQIQFLGANQDEFEVKGTFIPCVPCGSDGVFPDKEIVIFKYGTFAAAITAGSFTIDKQGRFNFNGVVNGVTLRAQIIPLGGGQFAFAFKGLNANLTGTNPADVPVGLTIKNDFGNARVPAVIL